MSANRKISYIQLNENFEKKKEKEIGSKSVCSVSNASYPTIYIHTMEYFNIQLAQIEVAKNIVFVLRRLYKIIAIPYSAEITSAFKILTKPIGHN